MQQPKDEIPQEEGEKFDQSSAQDTENELNEEKVQEEFKKFAEAISALDAKDTKPLTDQLNKLAEKEKLSDKDIQRILTILWQIDQSEFMIKVRKLWDRCPGLVQKIIFYGPNIGLSPMFKILIGLGFLEVKKLSSEAVQKHQELSLWTAKWGTRIASFVVPEVKPFQPLIEVLLKLAKHGSDFTKTSRPYLAQKRAEEEKKQKKGVKGNPQEKV